MQCPSLNLMGTTCGVIIEMEVCCLHASEEIGRQGENFRSSQMVGPPLSHHAINLVNPLGELLMKCPSWLKAYKGQHPSHPMWEEVSEDFEVISNFEKIFPKSTKNLLHLGKC